LLEKIREITNGNIPWLRDLGVASAHRFVLRFDLARDGLGRSPFQEPTVHACPASHQFRNYTAVSFASLRKGETMNTKKIALLVLLGSLVVVHAAQAQIKHIEMRVEGMT